MTDDFDRIRSVLRGEMERDIRAEREAYDDWATSICKDCGIPMRHHPFPARCSGETVTGYRWNEHLRRPVPWDEETGRQRVVLLPTEAA